MFFESFFFFEFKDVMLFWFLDLKYICGSLEEEFLLLLLLVDNEWNFFVLCLVKLYW